MIRHGEPPYLECSSRGDRRFSAFGARIIARGGRSIEEVYQATKIFDDGTTGLSWREAKGRRAVNQSDVNVVYVDLWRQYLDENPALLDVLISATGLSDMFGQPGHMCQATVLWQLRNERVKERMQMSLLSAIKAEDADQLPYLNTGSLLDLATGTFQLGIDGSTLLSGGLAMTNGIQGRPQTFKSTMALGWLMNAAARYVGTEVYIYDTENSLKKERLARMPNLHRDDAIRRAGMIGTLMDNMRIVDKTQHDLDSFVETVKEMAEIKAKRRDEFVVETPFADRKTGKPMRILKPTFVVFDSWSAAGTKIGDELLEKHGSLDSETNMYFMREALAKTKTLNQLVQMGPKLGIYFILTAHLGDKRMENPMIPPSKDLQFMKQGDKVKNVGASYQFLMSHGIETRVVQQLVDSNKEAMYPYPTGITSPTEMNAITSIMTRSKNRGAGVQFRTVVTQTDGIDVELSNYDYLRENEYFGLCGADGKSNKVNHRPMLKPDTSLSRTTATAKLVDYKTSRAVELLAQLCFVQNNWSMRDLLVPFDMSPDVFADALLTKCDYAVDDILNSRGWWTYGEHERHYLSLFDIMTIITGHYRPKFLQVKIFYKRLIHLILGLVLDNGLLLRCLSMLMIKPSIFQLNF